MLPKPLPSASVNCQHIHISINPTHYEDAFLAGILHRLRSICACTLPYHQSYRRVQKIEAGETVSWGTENRNLPIRKIKAGHWQIRCADATANMYLAVALVLAAGFLGIENQETLRWKDKSSKDLSDSMKFSQPPQEALPRSLDQALDILDANSYELEHIMESKVITHYLSLKRHESEVLGELDDDTLFSVLSQWIQNFRQSAGSVRRSFEQARLGLQQYTCTKGNISHATLDGSKSSIELFAV
ncbi:uncharacterized protein ATNIH1004_003077 [Aspergillus tanneri]|uniref:GS catalytic domain-containing protein n=1 Tax=Aspergillus tanneri TaxID=1220188 RepID=A0A5M9MZR9_9EURO|nr:uncharacterized protein ATNIH1004_003077 [Aspergillus tanneri]KAA8650393.1 hypothetical protein ATNIH1004_003077 [Aspergillus tanneri]